MRSPRPRFLVCAAACTTLGCGAVVHNQVAMGVGGTFNFLAGIVLPSSYDVAMEQRGSWRDTTERCRFEHQVCRCAGVNRKKLY